MRALLTLVSTAFLLAVSPTAAQVASQEVQIQAAVQALPEYYRADATVMGYTDELELVALREGTNGIICLADDPADNRFHVACYHESLEPFMESGRSLRAQGHDSDELEALRREAIVAGEVPMPQQAAALYSLTGAADAWDSVSGLLGDVRALQVIYLPHATLESTGLPPSAPPGNPWLMDPGEPWAHVMILTPRSANP